VGPLTLIVKGVSGIGTGTWLIGRAGRGIWRSTWEGDPLVERSLAQALALFVWRPLFTLIPLAALVGLITGIAAARILGLYRAELVVMGGLVETLLRDVQPLVVGLFVSGSVSVELSSRLGAMSLNREIDALEMLGHDPARHVLGPSLAAVLTAAPVHMLSAAAAGLLACAIPLQVSANVAWPDFARIALSDAAAGGRAFSPKPR
jgi:ABC-type transporter Mla maintaining outer membrane lipid asymmetry permease subunit MlaE